MASHDMDGPPGERFTAEAAVRDHLANERTLLAWQRTALAMVGIGFLVDRFALGPTGPTLFGSVLGTALIALGGAVSVMAPTASSAPSGRSTRRRTDPLCLLISCSRAPSSWVR